MLNELDVPAVHQEWAMDMLFKHRVDKQTAAVALLKCNAGGSLGDRIDILAKESTRGYKTRGLSTLQEDKRKGEVNEKMDNKRAKKLDPCKKDMSGWTREEVFYLSTYVYVMSVILTKHNHSNISHISPPPFTLVIDTQGRRCFYVLW